MNNFFLNSLFIQIDILITSFIKRGKLDKLFFLGLILIISASCSHPTPRKPIKHTSGYDASESIAFNKMLYQQEADMIKNYILKDSTHQYVDSHLGFWYTFLNKIENDSIFPVKGNTVTLQYEVHDFKGNQIYSINEIGNITYKVDHEEMIQGINEGIKNINQGEKVLFLFPSHKAYAYHGDDKKLGPNTPIIVTLELLKINTN